MTVLGNAHNIKYPTCNLPIHFITHTTLEFEKIICIFQAVGLVRPIVELKTYKQAQNAPTPYAVFAVIYDGQLLADHQISAGRFRNIMKKIQE